MCWSALRETEPFTGTLIMDEIFEIERGIPIPSKLTRYRESKYPFRKMAVGESFFAPFVEGHTTRKSFRNTLSSMARDQTAESGWKFSMRTEESGIRMWRTA